MKLRKSIPFIAFLILVFLVAFSSGAIAKGPKAKGPGEKAQGPHEKATGNVGYFANGVYRSIEFNAHEQATECQPYLVGDWEVSLDLGGKVPVYQMTITEQDDEGNLSGTGSHMWTYWTLTNSFVEGNQVWLEFDYDTSDYIVFLEGYIDSEGAMSGIWHSTSEGSGGTWHTTLGAADLSTCAAEGRGMLRYEDENSDWYEVEVAFVNVRGENAWLAGPVVSASNPTWVGNWLFAKAHDGGEPARGVDQFSGSFTTMKEAKAGVVLMWDPEDGPFVVEDGNLQVHAD